MMPVTGHQIQAFKVLGNAQRLKGNVKRDGVSRQAAWLGKEMLDRKLVAMDVQDVKEQLVSLKNWNSMMPACRLCRAISGSLIVMSRRPELNVKSIGIWGFVIEDPRVMNGSNTTQRFRLGGFTAHIRLYHLY